MAIAAEDENPVNLWPYVLQVSLVYIVATVVVGAIQYLVNLEPNIAIGIGILLASSVMPVRNLSLIITGLSSGASSFALHSLRLSPSLL